MKRNVLDGEPEKLAKLLASLGGLDGQRLKEHWRSLHGRAAGPTRPVYAGTGNRLSVAGEGLRRPQTYYPPTPAAGRHGGRRASCHEHNVRAQSQARRRATARVARGYPSGDRLDRRRAIPRQDIPLRQIGRAVICNRDLGRQRFFSTRSVTARRMVMGATFLNAAILVRKFRSSRRGLPSNAANVQRSDKNSTI